MDDMLGEFEARLPETIGAEDSQTHYDLGIAYKEMGMLDEAVHEFEVALGGRGTRRVVDCLTMLGICLGEKGQYDEAIARFQEALKTPGLTLEGSKEAHYQIGTAREAQGLTREAFGHLARVFKADPAFRDVKEKVQTLQRQLRSAPPRRPQSDSLAVGRASLVPPTRPRAQPAGTEPTEGRPPAGGRGKIGYV
jgi:tetratricopeptide (TPR) repeat protein